VCDCETDTRCCASNGDYAVFEEIPCVGKLRRFNGVSEETYTATLMSWKQSWEQRRIWRFDLSPGFSDTSIRPVSW
jgi:hypothetical protein